MRSSSKREKAADVARHELIGRKTSVESPHVGWHGVTGRVVDETKNTFLLETAPGSVIRVPKSGQRFVFRSGNERFVVQGQDITFRPEDRTKKIRG